MAAGVILNDVLNNLLAVDNLLEWLSSEGNLKKEDSLFTHFECSQVEFVTYFLMYLREQSSRNFEVFDAETPRKTLCSRKIKNTDSLTSNSNPLVRSCQNSLQYGNNLDLESLHLFPNLSSSLSFNLESNEKKVPESTPNRVQVQSNKENSGNKLRRVKLFSETLETNINKNDAVQNEFEFYSILDERCENKLLASTPKALKNQSLSNNDSSNNFDVPEVCSSKAGDRAQWINQSCDASGSEIVPVPAKSKSFSGNPSQKNKDNKTGGRMSLGDFILNDFHSIESKKEKKGKTKKRISTVKLNNQSPLNEKTDDDDGDALVVLEECQLSEFNNDKSAERTSTSVTKNSKVIFSTSEQSPVKEQPKLQLTTFTNELKILAKIYSFLICENFCQNIMMELCFIVSLLVIQDCDKKISASAFNGNEKKFFGSIHNCVFFAVEMLWLQKNCFLLLNLSALKLLSENDRIQKFNGDLKEFLVNAYSQRQSKEEMKRNNLRLLKTGMQGNVSFQYETDNRENFTSDFSFHSFRKQRDLFYNILAIWEANHLVSGWVFSVGLGSKIRSLLSISSDPINLLHFARLFRNQLVTSCCGENQVEEEDLNEKILQLLPTADPNKILRLRARLTSSPKRQGPCPPPDFTGHQEFYKDFILHTGHTTFQEHLKNSFCDEILRLNDTDLIEDIEDEDTSLDEQTEERYLQCINVLRLLAKFLGFLEFLPYRGEKSFSDRILNIHCSVRSNTLPLFDVSECLLLALKKQKLILTIPWIVSYLSMIDPYSARLKIFQDVWSVLILIYRRLKTFKNIKNSFYLKLILGWIFQLPSFPSEKFYSVLDEFNKNYSELPDITVKNDGTRSLDSYDFIEDCVLYALCPYLNEINVILSENSGCNVRHVRPVTTQETNSNKSQASKQLELRLEGNFLHNQSSSTRKTVEFVTERVASITIKHLVHEVIPKVKASAWAELDNLSVNNLREAQGLAENLSEPCYKNLLSACEKQNWEISMKRSNVALRALLSSDLKSSVVETCAKIVARQSMERVERWMQSHVTHAMVKKEFLSIIRKKIVKKTSELMAGTPDAIDILSKSTCKDDYHLSINKKNRVASRETVAWPASQSIKALRDSICNVCEVDVTPSQIQSILVEITNTVKYRKDVIPAAGKTMLSLTLDLVIVFCIRSTNNDLVDIFKAFSALLNEVEEDSRCGLDRIICARNVAMISKTKNKENAWANLGKLLFVLLEENLLPKEQLETQLLSLFRRPYNKEDGNYFFKFISHVLERYTNKWGCDKFSLLLEYMIETLQDDELKPDGFS